MSRAVVADLRREQPDLIMVLRPGPDRWDWGVRRLDYVRYFESDPAFAREFESYGYLTDVGEYRVFKRMPADQRRAAPPEVHPEGVEPPLTALRAGLYLAPLGPLSLLQAAVFLAVFAVSFVRPGSPDSIAGQKALDGR
jgi:hypothetical protein